MNSRTTILAVTLTIAALGLTACGSANAADTSSASKPSASASPTPSPAPTLSALDKSICRAYEAAMLGPAADHWSSIRRVFEDGAMLAIYETTLERTARDLAVLPAATDDDLAAGLLDVTVSLGPLNIKVNAYRDGVLNIAQEYTAFRAADRAVVAACA